MAFSFFKSKDRGKQKDGSAKASVPRGERSSNPQVSIKLAEHFLRENKRELAVDEYLNAAQAFLDKRQSQLAMAVYRNVITIAPERYGVYETLADLYRMSGFPGDGASVLLALAYQYKTAGRDIEVKRVLDSVLEFAPDNPVLKRKVAAFFETEGRLAAPSVRPGAAIPKPVAPAAQRVAPPAQPVSVRKPDAPAVQKVALPQPGAAAPKPVAPAAQRAAPPAQPVSVLKPDMPAVQKVAPAQPIAASPKPVVPARQPVAPGKKPATPAQPPPVPDETVRSFFDLQSALATDATLRFDHDASSEDMLNADQESSVFSVLNVVKNIARQDPRQDTPLFHFNLGVAYMQCGDYEQAVDELLSALYGTSDKIGCYMRLAECSLQLQRRELACGFLREALDEPDIRADQAMAVRRRLDEISSV